ncbi:hypothetical protein [Porcipelethomonas sp.]|uniref:hypothetical protein n=1 Tax=Porcipelethomonas sp. TaxID=2981675 RepID=UPI003079E04E
MKINKLKSIIAFALSALVGLNSMGTLIYATNEDNCFTYTVENGVATITKFDNSLTVMTMPEQVTIDGNTYEYKNGTLLLKSGLLKNSSSNPISVKKVIFPNVYNSLGNQQMFMNTTSLTEVIFNYEGENFTFNTGSFYGCSGLEKIYIYAQTISYQSKSNMFTKVPTTAVAYIKNDTVKAILEELKWPGQIIVDPNMSNTPIVSVDKTNLANKITEVETFIAGVEDETKYNNIEELKVALASAKTVNENNSATQEEVNSAIISLSTALKNTTKKVEKTALSSKITEAETFLSGIDKSKYNNVAALETAIAHAKTVNENALATQTEVDNEVTALTSALSNVKPIDKSILAVRISNAEKRLADIDKTQYTNVEAYEQALAYAKTVYDNESATQEEIDNAEEALYSAGRNMKPIVDKTALKATIDNADAFIENKLESDYDNYKDFISALDTAKIAYKDDGHYTQDQLDDIKDRLIAAQEKVTKADASEEKAQLDKLIEQAEALESDIFTEESWTPVETALTEAKAINDGLKSEYNAVIEKLNTALKGLVGIELPTVPAGKPFAKVYKKGRTATVINTTADKDMAKATKIRVTFDCAEDVSYNPNASIEIKAMVGGIESYKKFIGKDSSYKNGETWTEELTLTEAINEGDNVELSAFTYSWDNAGP